MCAPSPASRARPGAGAPAFGVAEFGVAEFGVYVHVPFCAQRCDYCAFSTYTDRDHLMDRYAAACVTEIRATRDSGELPEATSVFFGGGTPSRLAAGTLGEILAEIPRAPGAEVTVECNPEDAGPERFFAYRSAGVTRVSIGVQSTVPHVLAALGRRHDPATVARAARWAAEAGFSSFNIDLILGAATESDADWEQSLSDVLSLAHPPPHVSAYALSVEAGTPLARDRARHPDDDVSARRYERTDEILGAAGYVWEEVSNWALPGHACRHNALYWRQGDYLGIGSAAHSHRAGRRWWNVRTPERYIDALGRGESAMAGQEVLSDEQRLFEALALSLRTPDGVPEWALPDDADLGGLVDRRDGRAVLTVSGRLMANELTARLQLAGEPSR